VCQESNDAAFAADHSLQSWWMAVGEKDDGGGEARPATSRNHGVHATMIVALTQRGELLRRVTTQDRSVKQHFRFIRLQMPIIDTSSM
jgi:hypothetical protein